MKSIYCPIEARDCSPIDCEDVSEYFLGIDCACLTPNELELLKDKIDNNADAIANFRVDQYRQMEQLYADLAPRFSALQELINDNTLRIADTNTRIDILGLALGNAIKDLANLEQYSKDFLKDVIDRHTSHINDLHKNVSENAGDIYNLQLQDDSLEELLNKIKNISLDNKENIQKILATLFAQGIFIEGVTDTEDLPEFGDASEGPCADCANKGDINHFTGDNYFYSLLELINRDFVIRHPFPKGTKPSKQSHLDVIWRDDAGNVTSDNISSVASMVEPNGDVKTALRAYRNVSGSIEHCDIILTTPQTGESYVELSNLIIGTQYNEYQCGTGWLETWDWIHGHTTLEIDKSVKLNVTGGDTNIYGDTHMHENVNMNVDGGTTVIEGPTYVYNTFDVAGDSHFNSNVTIEGDTNINGSVVVKGYVDSNTGGGSGTNSASGGRLFAVKGYCCKDFYASGVSSLRNVFEIFQCSSGDGYMAMGVIGRMYGGLDFIPCTPSPKVILGQKVSPGITFSSWGSDNKSTALQCALSRGDDQFGKNRIYFDRFASGKRNRWILEGAARKYSANPSDGILFAQLFNSGYFIMTGGLPASGANGLTTQTVTIPFPVTLFTVNATYNTAPAHGVDRSSELEGAARMMSNIEDLFGEKIFSVYAGDSCTCDLGSIWAAINEIKNDINKIKGYLSNKLQRPLRVTYSGNSFTVSGDGTFDWICAGYAEIDDTGTIPDWFLKDDVVVPDTPPDPPKEPCSIQKPTITGWEAADNGNIAFLVSEFVGNGVSAVGHTAYAAVSTDPGFSSTIFCDQGSSISPRITVRASHLAAAGITKGGPGKTLYVKFKYREQSNDCGWIESEEATYSAFIKI